MAIENKIWRCSYKLQNTFLKSRKGLRVPYFQVWVIPFNDSWRKKIIYQKIMFSTVEGNVIISSCAIEFSIPSSFTEPETLLKKRLWHRCCLVNFAKFLRTLFSQNTPERLLLDFEIVQTKNLYQISCGNFWIELLIIAFIALTSQPAHDIPGTSPESPLKALTSKTYREPSGDQYKNW